METARTTTAVQQDIGPTFESLAEDLLRVIQRKKRLIAFVVVVSTVVAFVGLQFVSDKYDTHASLIVKLGLENAEVPVTINKGTVHRQGVMKEEVNTYIALMKSIPILESVVDEIGLERFTHQPEEADGLIDWVKIQLKSTVRWSKARLNDTLILLNLRKRLDERDLAVIGIQQRLSIEQEKDSNVILLNIRLPDPELGKDVLETLIRKYIALHKKTFLGHSSIVTALDSQIKTYRGQLNEQNKDLSALKRQLGVSSIDDRLASLESLEKEVESELLKNQRRLAQLNSTSEKVADERSKLEEMVLAEKLLEPNASHEAMAQSLASLSVVRSSLLSDFLEESPQIRAIDYEIEALQKQLDSVGDDSMLTLKYVRNPVLAQFEGQLEAMNVEMASLESLIEAAKSQIAEIREKANQLNESYTAIKELELNIAVTEQSLLKISTEHEEARSRELLSHADIANVSMLIPPNYSPKPVAPKRLILLLAAVIGSAGLGFALALFLEWQNKAIGSVDKTGRKRNEASSSET